jgi:Gnt-I system high-affinity gluconate transporter
MAMILLVIGAGGAFKNVLVEGGISDYIKDVTESWSISAIVLAWLIAAILRVALGSATVAVVTASGVVLPLLAGSGAHAEMMVLAVSCGSVAFSHVNDPGFWLFKEYFNLSVIQAIKVRTTYTTVLSVLGLGGVLAAEWALDVMSL